MKRQNVDLVIENNRIFCFNGFDNTAASILDILFFEKNKNSSKRIERGWCPSQYMLITTSRQENCEK